MKICLWGSVIKQQEIKAGQVVRDSLKIRLETL